MCLNRVLLPEPDGRERRTPPLAHLKTRHRGESLVSHSRAQMPDFNGNICFLRRLMSAKGNLPLQMRRPPPRSDTILGDDSARGGNADRDRALACLQTSQTTDRGNDQPEHDALR